MHNLLLNPVGRHLFMSSGALPWQQLTSQPGQDPRHRAAPQALRQSVKTAAGGALRCVASFCDTLILSPPHLPLIATADLAQALDHRPLSITSELHHCPTLSNDEISDFGWASFALHRLLGHFVWYCAQQQFSEDYAAIDSSQDPTIAQHAPLEVSFQSPASWLPVC